MSVTKAGKLYELFGGMVRLAEAINRDNALVSRWNSFRPRGGKGLVPPHYNVSIITAARDKVKRKEIPEGYTAKSFLAAVSACLDEHVCPMCKRPLEPGQMLDKRIVRTAMGTKK